MLVSLIPSVTAIVFSLVVASTCGILTQASSTSFVAITAKTGTSAAVGLYVTSFYIGGTFGGWLPGACLRGRRLALFARAGDRHAVDHGADRRDVLEAIEWHDMRARQKDRRETNPALSTRRLKLGTFQTNLDSGCVMSDLDGRLDITWANTVALAKLADEMEFEALVPVARWQGWGGKTNPQGPGFEAYTWAAGIAGVDAQGRRGLDLAHHHQPSDHRRQAIGGDRPHLRRPLHPQHRHRLGAARDRDVRPADAVATRSATPAPRNGSPSSSGCGPRTSRSTTRAASSRSRRAIWRRSRSSTPTPRS